MKPYLSLALVLVCVGACASTKPQPSNAATPDDATNSYIFREEVEPNFTDPKLAVGEKKSVIHPDTVVDANTAYTNSIQSITQTMIYEATVLASCIHTKQNDPCAVTQKEFCAVDELIDAHGIIHKKPYCLPAWNMKLK